MADAASAAELEAVRAAVEDGATAVPVDAEGHEDREMNETARYMTTPQAGGVPGPEPAHTGELPVPAAEVRLTMISAAWCAICCPIS